MKTPEEAAREWINREPKGEPQLSYYNSVEEMNAALAAQKAAATESLAALLRQRDAEHAKRLREERGRLWDAGAAAQEELDSVVTGANYMPGSYTQNDVDEATADFAAARRAAVESAGEPGEEQP